MLDLAPIVIGLALAHGHKDTDRLRGVAEDITSVSAESTLFCGPRQADATALALVAVAEHESGFWRRVQDCSVCDGVTGWCDRGRSISLWQLHVGSGAWQGFTRAEVCSNNDIAARLALRILERHRKASHPASLFFGYARGARIGAGREMFDIFSTLIRKAGIVVTYRDGCLHAR